MIWLILSYYTSLKALAIHNCSLIFFFVLKQDVQDLLNVIICCGRLQCAAPGTGMAAAAKFAEKIADVDNMILIKNIVADTDQHLFFFRTVKSDFNAGMAFREEGIG